MALTLSLPPLYPDGTFESYTLRNVNANTSPGSPDINFYGTQRLNEDSRSRIDVYRGQLALSADEPPLDVVCKIGYGKKARDRVAHEASLYSDTLRHLQDVCIPLCHGCFAGDTDEGPTACILLAYCGEPIQDMLMHLPAAFKTGLVNALVGMHDAGVKHLDLCRGNILDHNGRPMIIDFGDALLHECGRRVAIREGAPGPSKVAEIGCAELYNFFMKLRIWTPAFIRYTGRSFPISSLSTHVRWRRWRRVIGRTKRRSRRRIGSSCSTSRRIILRNSTAGEPASRRRGEPLKPQRLLVTPLSPATFETLLLIM